MVEISHGPRTAVAGVVVGLADTEGDRVAVGDPAAAVEAGVSRSNCTQSTLVRSLWLTL